MEDDVASALARYELQASDSERGCHPLFFLAHARLSALRQDIQCRHGPQATIGGGALYTDDVIDKSSISTEH